MKRAIVLIFAFIVCMMTYAQYGKETLYLNNGNVVKGMITEEVYGETVTIKREDGSIVTYKISDIQKKRRELPNDISTEKEEEPTSVLKTGLRYFAANSFGVGFGLWGEPKSEFSLAIGAQIKPNLFIGAGGAMQWWGDYEVLAAPIFGKIRLDILDKKFSPFVAVRVGYTFIENSGGLYFAPQVGMRLVNYLSLSLAPEFTRCEVAEIDPGFWDEYKGKTQTIGALMVKVGIDLGAR